MIFSHGGDYGDIIYALPAIKLWAEEHGETPTLILYKSGVTRAPMTEEHAQFILPLLKLQPYLKNAIWADAPGGDRIDMAIRFHYKEGQSLPEMHIRYLQLPVPEIWEPWLTYAPMLSNKTLVLARSQRYHGVLEWKKVIEGIDKRSIGFIGTTPEYESFVKEFGEIDRLGVRDCLDMAALIKASELFVGNQSLPMAIAHGLGVNSIMEVCPWLDNCSLKRNKVVYIK